jgi:hypothetical protein
MSDTAGLEPGPQLGQGLPRVPHSTGLVASFTSQLKWTLTFNTHCLAISGMGFRMEFSLQGFSSHLHPK